jgi:hypothetical protein
MKGRPLKLPFLFFLIIIFIILFSILEAYSTLITISEVEPLPRRDSTTYFLSKYTGSQGQFNFMVETRSVELQPTGDYVNSAVITLYWNVDAPPGQDGREFTISVSLYDDNGGSLTSGSVTVCLRRGTNSGSYTIPLSSANIDDVASVGTSITDQGWCKIP